MEKKHGPWTIRETEQKYCHDLVEVYEDQVTRPDGEPGVYAVVKIKPGSSVIAVGDDRMAYLAGQFRYGVGRDSVEAACGCVEDDEGPAQAARRELSEELGIEAENFVDLGRVDPLTAMLDAPSYLFLATGLSFKEKEQEGSEEIRMVKLPLDEAVRQALEGEITDATSCVLILRAWHYLAAAGNSHGDTEAQRRQREKKKD